MLRPARSVGKEQSAHETWNLIRGALSSCVTAALLAGCGVLPLSPSKGQDDMQPPSGAPARSAAVPSSVAYSVIYSFKGGADGANPRASLRDVKGTLYGTTYEGGGTECQNSAGCGTVFSITPSGTETVLHAFGGTPDGANPAASLADVNGTLYGTTNGGGAVKIRYNLWNGICNDHRSPG